MGPYLLVLKSPDQPQKETLGGVVQRAGAQKEASVSMNQARPLPKVSGQGPSSAVGKRFKGAMSATIPKLVHHPKAQIKGPDKPRLTSKR